MGDIFGLTLSAEILETSPWYVALWVMAGLMIVWAVVNMIFLRGTPPPLSLDWQYKEDEPTELVDGESSGSSASFCQVLRVPGLMLYSSCYLFIKLVNYALFLWLPFYLSEGIGVDKSQASLMATRFDLGFIVGAVLAGLLSDVTTHWAGRPMRSPIVSGFLLLSLLPMSILRFSTDPKTIQIAIFFCGILQGGPADALTSAVSVDLGKHPSLKGARATATVTGIIDGTGAVGAAIGQYLVGLMSDELGWKSVFLVLLICLGLAFFSSLFRLSRELSELRASRERAVDSESSDDSKFDSGA